MFFNTIIIIIIIIIIKPSPARSRKRNSTITKRFRLKKNSSSARDQNPKYSEWPRPCFSPKTKINAPFPRIGRPNRSVRLPRSRPFAPRRGNRFRTRFTRLQRACTEEVRLGYVTLPYAEQWYYYYNNIFMNLLTTDGGGVVNDSRRAPPLRCR